MKFFPLLRGFWVDHARADRARSSVDWNTPERMCPGDRPKDITHFSTVAAQERQFLDLSIIEG